jgi:hypothetical protein
MGDRGERFTIMKRVLCLTMVALFGLVGCSSGSSSKPATRSSSKPAATTPTTAAPPTTAATQDDVTITAADCILTIHNHTTQTLTYDVGIKQGTPSTLVDGGKLTTYGPVAPGASLPPVDLGKKGFTNCTIAAVVTRSQ